jgi:hypothetical protein
VSSRNSLEAKDGSKKMMYEYSDQFIEPSEGETDTSGEDDSLELFTHLFGEQHGVIGGFSGLRSAAGHKRLEETRSAYFPYPDERNRALDWLRKEATRERETYFCAHLLMARRRVKENAAPLSALYVDGDGAKPSPGMPSPTAVVQSSPGREQFYWRLTEPLVPEFGEWLNRRLAVAMGGDKAGWDLTQLLRPPGTSNFKYAEAPLVHLLEIKDERHDPVELDRLLPPLPQELTERATRSHRPRDLGAAPDLLGLSKRMQNLIRHGNCGEYGSRSEADMAACVAMFGAGYGVEEVWAVMTDPTNVISEKFTEKGRHGERYLGLTIAKARALAKTGRRKIYVGPPKSAPVEQKKVVIRVG